MSPALNGCSAVRADAANDFDQRASASRDGAAGRSPGSKKRGAAPLPMAIRSWQSFCKAPTAWAGA